MTMHPACAASGAYFAEIEPRRRTIRSAPWKNRSLQILNGERLVTERYPFASRTFACQGIDLVDREFPFGKDLQHRFADRTGCTHHCHIEFACHFLNYLFTEPARAGELKSRSVMHRRATRQPLHHPFPGFRRPACPGTRYPRYASPRRAPCRPPARCDRPAPVRPECNGASSPPRKSSPADWRFPCRRYPAPSRESARTSPCRDFQRRRGQHADRSGQHGGVVGENIAEHIAGDHDIELLGCSAPVAWRHYPRTGGSIRRPGIPSAKRVDDLAPQLGTLQHIGLVDRTQACERLRAISKPHAPDALDLRFTVNQRVETFTLTILPDFGCRAACRNKSRRSARA